jgi:Methyltransferase domain
MLGSPLERLKYAARASRAVAADPYEGSQRVLERVAEWREGMKERRLRYLPSPDCDTRLHELLGAEWPCPTRREFEELWARLATVLQQRGLSQGRGAFGGWDDADTGLARVTWCLTRHLRPEVVVETGVARGLTSAVILEALERNGSGRLWSVDLPPLLERDLQMETAVAVPDERRGRWTLLRGSSRRLLPGLAAGLGRIDLFVHDSMHTARNVNFELGSVWPRLRSGGAVVIDDVEKNSAFGSFTRTHPEARALVCAADDQRALFGCLLKP